MLPDPRDAALVEMLATTVADLIAAIHANDAERASREMVKLANTIVVHRDSLAHARPDDAALRRAVARLNA